MNCVTDRSLHDYIHIPIHQTIQMCTTKIESKSDRNLQCVYLLHFYTLFIDIQAANTQVKVNNFYAITWVVIDPILRM